MRNNTPKISVVMSAYNAEKYIGEAVQSVLDQTFIDYEFIMINDGSTDRTLDILEFYAKKDPRCIVQSWENKGIVASVNQGIHLARADIIFRMDADDVCMPQRFEKQLQYLNTHPECVAVGSNVLLIDTEGLPILTWLYLQEHEEIDSINLTGTVGSSMCNPSVALRKSSVLAIGGYRADLEWAEDYDLFLRLAEIGKLANLPEVLLKYRQHVASAGHAKRKQQLTMSLKALEDTFKRRQLTFDAKTAFLQSVNDYSTPSKQDIHLKWAWWALSEKNYQTSIKHGFKVLWHNPFNMITYKLFICVIRGLILKK